MQSYMGLNYHRIFLCIFGGLWYLQYLFSNNGVKIEHNFRCQVQCQKWPHIMLSVAIYIMAYILGGGFVRACEGLWEKSLVFPRVSHFDLLVCWLCHIHKLPLHSSHDNWCSSIVIPCHQHEKFIPHLIILSHTWHHSLSHTKEFITPHKCLI